MGFTYVSLAVCFITTSFMQFFSENKKNSQLRQTLSFIRHRFPVSLYNRLFASEDCNYFYYSFKKIV